MNAILLCCCVVPDTSQSITSVSKKYVLLHQLTENGIWNAARKLLNTPRVIELINGSFYGVEIYFEFTAYQETHSICAKVSDDFGIV